MQISFIILLSMLGTASSIGAVSFLNPPGGAAHSRAEYRGEGVRGTWGYTGGVQDPGQARRGRPCCRKGSEDQIHGKVYTLAIHP